MREKMDEKNMKGAPGADGAARRRPRWGRLLKWLGISVAAILLLLLAAVGAAVWYLGPERLTPLATRYATDYLDAKVAAERVELSFWSTFPRLELEVCGLTVVSEAFDSLDAESRAQLPADADTLLTMERFRGAVNLLRLAQGAIALHNVELHHPAVNLVTAAGGRANYDIVPPSEETKEKQPLTIPDIDINRFAIIGPTPVRYCSVPDSIDVTATLHTTTLEGTDAPVYTLTVEGDGTGTVAELLRLTQLPFGIDGNVRWRTAEPLRVAFEKFNIKVDDVKLTVDAIVDFADSLALEGVEVVAEKLRLDALLAASQKLGLATPERLRTDLTMDLMVKLRSRYLPAGTLLPDVEAHLTVPDGTLSYGRLQISGFEADIRAMVPGGDLSRAEAHIDRLRVVGQGLGFKLNAVARAAGDIADPMINGHFDGGVGFAHLPQPLLARLPFTLEGVLTGSTSFRFKPSWLTADDFHHIKADGNVTLNNFAMAMRDGSATAYSRRAALRFDSDNVVRTDRRTVDSMLTVALDIDTLSYGADGIRFAGSTLHAALGARNVEATFDTTQITPIGGRITARRFTMASDSDSINIRLRDVSATASLSRYRGSGASRRRPLLTLGVQGASMRYSDRLNRASLRDVDMNLRLHPRRHPNLSKRALAIYDSLEHALPNLSPDSIYALTQTELKSTRRRRGRTADGDSTLRRTKNAEKETTATTNLDFGVDNSLQAWLRLWQLSGEIKARRARAFTPYFPVRNVLSDVDVGFNTDSVVIRTMRYRSGRTSLSVNGSVSNIASALTTRRGNPVTLRLNVDCDTLDINAFADAAFAGAAFAAREDSTHVSISTSENEEEVQRSIEEAAAGNKLAYVVPANVAADVTINAREVLYADIWFQRLTGKMEVADGAIHLNRLAGYTDMGTIDLTALYSAPNIRNVDFAAGLVVRRLDLKKFLHMIPEVDSLLPLLRHVEGYITADMAMTTALDSVMDIRFNTLKAALRLEGDSLVLLDNHTFRTLSKWLLFKRKDRNLIDHMAVEMTVDDSYLNVMPFLFDFDRYRLGVWGGNDLDMNYDYHVAVLKSPIPFKFGVTVKGHGDKFKIRLGRANFDPNRVVSSRQLTDTARINLINEIREVFRFGVKTGKQNKKITLSTQGSTSRTAPEYGVSDNLTHADSVLFMQEGVIPMTTEVADSIAAARAIAEQHDKKTKKGRKNKKK